MPHPRFKVSKNSDAEYSFNLTAANAEIILSSERYTTRSGAEAGIAAVKANAADESKYQRREAQDGTLYFVLRAANNEIVGMSEMYTSGGAREKGVPK